MIEEISRAIADHFEIDPDIISPETDIIDALDADSLDVLDLLMDLEEKFGFHVPNNRIDEIRTVESIVAFIREQRM